MIIGNPIMAGASGPVASIFVTGLSQTDTVTATNGSKTLPGKWMQKMNPAYVVPDGYTQLEYIESTGTQYIQTGISAPNGFRISCEIMNNLGAYSTICSARPTNTNVDNNGLYWEGSGQIAVAAGGWATGGSHVTNKKYQVDASTIVGNLFFKLDDVSQSFSFSSSYPQTNQRSGNLLTLFATITVEGEVKGFAQDTLYAAKIYTSIDDSELVGDFIPCKRTSDNAIGLYDLVSNSFFGNAGTGTFTAGPEIPQTFDGFLIKPIRDFGTWTVTATDGEKTATQDVFVDVITEYEIEMRYPYYSEQELNNMGCYISRSVGDTLKQTTERYAKRSGDKPMIACAFNGGGNGYAIISDEPITESFTYSQYGELIDTTGTGLVAYVKAMGSVYGGQQSYLNTTDNMLSEIFTATRGSDDSTWVVDSSYIELLNHIAESIPSE